MTSQNVEVKLELGHRATIRSKTTADGFTHDWTLFVRGPEGCNIQHFVEKVVFLLHESFPKPKRVLKEPPYNVSESGYAGFNLAIEVHFRNKEEPKKVPFDYDLYLQLEGPPINNSRLEKLTFKNPNPEFRKKLLKGGGVAISGGSQSNNCSNSNPVHTETEPTPKSKSSIKGSNEGPKKTPKVKLPYVAKEVPAKVPEPPHQPFTQIFGAPIKTKPSPDTSHKSKENAKEKSSSTSNSKTTPITSTPSTETTASSSLSSSSLQTSNSKSSSKDSHKTSSNKEKVSKSSSKESEKKESKSSSQSKSSTLKRLPSPSQNQGHNKDDESNNKKKRKRSTSTSSATSSVADKPGSNKERKVKSKDSELKIENKVLTTPEVPVLQKKDIQKQGKPAQTAPRKEPQELKSQAKVADVEKDQESVSTERARVESEGSENSHSSQEEKDPKPEDGNSRSSAGSASSPTSSLSLSSVMPGSAHGPLATMMAQMEQELVSPLSSDQGSPAHSAASPESEEQAPSSPCSPISSSIPNKVDKQSSKKVKEKNHSEKLTQKKRVKEEASDCPPPPPPPPPPQFTPQSKVDGKQQPIDAAYLRELMQLQERIMALRDKQHLQRIVDVIEETGLYQITSSTIDFDLCALDRSTVQKLQNCMTVT